MEKETLTLDPVLREEVRQETIAMIRQSPLVISDAELDQMQIVDFGLGNVRAEGAEIINLFVSEHMRIAIICLLPNQTLPQHRHPPIGGDPGKEEVIRVIWGQCRLYLPGEANNPNLRIPVGKDRFYTCRHEIVISPTEQARVAPNTEHWFQGGEEGAVTWGFYSHARDEYNIFYDTAIEGTCVENEY